MADTTKIRIGLTAAREIEVDVADAKAVSEQLEQAMTSGEGVVWIEDSSGNRHALAAACIAFFEVRSGSSNGGIGFGS
ncbi:hypothetical protein MNBD_ACTINO02-2538 [hydrothermal vent metagenome]|jgi:Protein of unknown function (DUF3107)|uniref:Uncharacterized protein n=1 Tax=hydrothermal vent metagenome TaxID=652676 RepID=A0A3B0SG24_9ZZZZ